MERGGGRLQDYNSLRYATHIVMSPPPPLLLRVCVWWWGVIDVNGKNSPGALVNNRIVFLCGRLRPNDTQVPLATRLRPNKKGLAAAPPKGNGITIGRRATICASTTNPKH
jgi:hypothetical protein